MNVMGLSRGLLFSWQHERIQLKLEGDNPNMQWCWGKIENTFFMNVANVYGSYEISKKIKFWRLLGEMIVKYVNEPIYLISDFNCVGNNEERVNCVFSNKLSDMFSEFINILNWLRLI